MHLRPLTLIGIVLSMVSGIALGITGYRSWLESRVESPQAQAFDEVLSQVHESYVDELDRDELVGNALRGMLHNLDDHSNYLDSTEYDDLQDEKTDGVPDRLDRVPDKGALDPFAARQVRVLHPGTEQIEKRARHGRADDGEREEGDRQDDQRDHHRGQIHEGRPQGQKHNQAQGSWWQRITESH